MFERFTERARRVIILARGEAEKYQHEYLGTEHLLLGIVREGTGTAIAVLKTLEFSQKQLEAELVARMRDWPVFAQAADRLLADAVPAPLTGGNA